MSWPCPLHILATKMLPLPAAAWPDDMGRCPFIEIKCYKVLAHYATRPPAKPEPNADHPPSRV